MGRKDASAIFSLDCLLENKYVLLVDAVTESYDVLSSFISLLTS